MNLKLTYVNISKFSTAVLRLDMNVFPLVVSNRNSLWCSVDNKVYPHSGCSPVLVSAKVNSYVVKA